MPDKSLSIAAGSTRPSLGDFLRARRDRLRPADFNYSDGVRRRAPGLRREEAAQLCGISPTWYTWIEQGRTTAVSVETLSSIATGLRLSRAERAYLFELASQADPASPRTPTEDPQRLLALVGAVRAPAYILDRHWDAIVWNKPAAQLFVDWLGPRGTFKNADRNLLRFVFLHPHARQFIVSWSERARRLVAEYRADTAIWSDDPVRNVLVHELCSASDEFSSSWSAQHVLSREGGNRSFQHPKHGSCHFEQYTLGVSQRTELKMNILVPHSA